MRNRYKLLVCACQGVLSASTELHHSHCIKWNKHYLALRWRHNEHDCVSNHQRFDCLLNRLFLSRSKKTSKLRVTGLCVGNSLGPVNSPHKGSVTRKMFPFDDVIMGYVIELDDYVSIWFLSRIHPQMYILWYNSFIVRIILSLKKIAENHLLLDIIARIVLALDHEYTLRELFVRSRSQLIFMPLVPRGHDCHIVLLFSSLHK